MTSQIRNEALNTLLETDFIRRNEPGNLLGNVISTYMALPGLRGFWPFSSIDENGDAYDLTGQGRTLANTNSVTFNNTDFLPYAEFDGSTNYFSRADEAGLSITGDLTLGCWVRFNNAYGTIEIPMSKLGNAANRSFRIERRTNGYLRFFYSQDGTTLVPSLNLSKTLDQNTWYFLAGKVEIGVGGYAYVDAVPGAAGSSVASIFDNTVNFTVGVDYNGTFFTDGDIALPFLCAYALPDNLITNLYQQTRILFEDQ